MRLFDLGMMNASLFQLILKTSCINQSLLAKTFNLQVLKCRLVNLFNRKNQFDPIYLFSSHRLNLRNSETEVQITVMSQLSFIVNNCYRLGAIMYQKTHFPVMTFSLALKPLTSMCPCKNSSKVSFILVKFGFNKQNYTY